jgi:hypothetical protein
MLAHCRPGATTDQQAIEETMHRPRPPSRSASLAILLGALCACTSEHYQNVGNPTLGDAEYTSDLAQCRRENSTVETIQGYDVQQRVTVDEAKAASCMTARGWRKVGG